MALTVSGIKLCTDHNSSVPGHKTVATVRLIIISRNGTSFSLSFLSCHQTTEWLVSVLAAA